MLHLPSCRVSLSCCCTYTDQTCVLCWDVPCCVPGVEIAGVVQDVCPSLPNSNFTTGDRVVMYPDEYLADSGYTEYIAVEDVDNCLQIPPEIPLEVAAMLPGGALSAYSAVLKAKPHVQKLQEVKCKFVI